MTRFSHRKDGPLRRSGQSLHPASPQAPSRRGLCDLPWAPILPSPPPSGAPGPQPSWHLPRLPAASEESVSSASAVPLAWAPVTPPFPDSELGPLPTPSPGTSTPGTPPALPTAPPPSCLPLPQICGSSPRTSGPPSAPSVLSRCSHVACHSPRPHPEWGPSCHWPGGRLHGPGLQQGPARGQDVAWRA